MRRGKPPDRQHFGVEVSVDGVSVFTFNLALSRDYWVGHPPTGAVRLAVLPSDPSVVEARRAGRLVTAWRRRRLNGQK